MIFSYNLTLLLRLNVNNVVCILSPTTTVVATVPYDLSLLCFLQLDIPSRPELFDFHGVSMTHHYTDNWENLQNFQARPDDVLIAAYPRSGQSSDMNRMCFT